MNDFFTLSRETGFGRFFIPFGIVCIVLSVLFFSSSNNTKDFIKTEGIVSRTELAEAEYYDGEEHHEATYTVYVKYTVDGVEYDEEYGVFSGYNVGDKVTISYNPNDPHDIAQPIGIVLPIVLSVIGIAGITGGIVSLVKAFKKHKKMKKQEEEWAHGN